MFLKPVLSPWMLSHNAYDVHTVVTAAGQCDRSTEPPTLSPDPPTPADSPSGMNDIHS